MIQADRSASRFGRFGSARSAIGPGDRLVGRFQVSRVGSSGKRAAPAILGGHPSKRTADKCARLYRPATLVALRRGRETYETAALPLSYVGRSASIGDDSRHQLFAARESRTGSCSPASTTLELADDREPATLEADGRPPSRRTTVRSAERQGRRAPARRCDNCCSSGIRSSRASDPHHRPHIWRTMGATRPWASRHRSILIESTIAWTSVRCAADVPA